MVCCNCKKNISDEDLFCRFCGARQSKVIEKKWTEFRTVKLDFDMYSSLPLIIKEEYSRLFNLLDEGQNYGAVLQLRDIYEICLKIPVIISMASICNKSKISEEEYRQIKINMQYSMRYQAPEPIQVVISEYNAYDNVSKSIDATPTYVTTSTDDDYGKSSIRHFKSWDEECEGNDCAINDYEGGIKHFQD